MAHEKLISELNSFINKNNLKKGKVEKDLGLPLNSLSNFLKLKKPLPDKWVQPIIKYCLGELSDKVTTEDKISKKDKFIKAFDDTVDQISTQTSWINQIEAYCGEMGILPTDLIETHRQSLKMAKKASKEGKESKIKEAKEYVSNWRSEYIKKKTGFEPEKRKET